MKILSYSKGAPTEELMNDVIGKLADLGYVDDDGEGHQVSSEATCNFEIHVVKKK